MHLNAKGQKYMALAKDLGPARCENILRDLVELTERTSGRKLGIHCPWHKEETPGACWYDPELDRAVCYGCQHHGDLVDIYAVKMGLPEGYGFKVVGISYSDNEKSINDNFSNLLSSL